MDKGIRPWCNNKFVELNELRRRGLLGNTQFRKNVIAAVMEEFGTTLPSAATHYNTAFKLVKDCTPELVSGLGRPEDKKGGRKKKVVIAPAAVAAVASVIPQPVNNILLNFIAAGAVKTPEPAQEAIPEAAPEVDMAAALEEGIEAALGSVGPEEVIPDQVPNDSDEGAEALLLTARDFDSVDELTPHEDGQTVFTVRKKSDDSVVAEGLSFEEARDMVTRAAAQKKAKLYWV